MVQGGLKKVQGGLEPPLAPHFPRLCFTPCNKCALCANHEKHLSMVPHTDCISNKNGKKIMLNQNLNCMNFRIDAAQCRKCTEIYVGQTKNGFSVRWTSHRNFWKSNIINNSHPDQAALLKHFLNHHTAFMQEQTNPLISDCFVVIFLQEPHDVCELDFLESTVDGLASFMQKLISIIPCCRNFVNCLFTLYLRIFFFFAL